MVPELGYVEDLDQAKNLELMNESRIESGAETHLRVLLFVTSTAIGEHPGSAVVVDA
jgi:hypothetical protein